MNILVIGNGPAGATAADSLRRHGGHEVRLCTAASAAMSPIEFDGDGSVASFDHRVAVVLGGARGRSGEMPWGDPAWELIDAVAASDAIVMAGYDLDEAWPRSMAEQLLVSRLARAFNTATVLWGQSVGRLGSGDTDAVAGEVVSDAALVGMADDASYEWARARTGSEVRRTVAAEAAVGLCARSARHATPADPCVLVAMAPLPSGRGDALDAACDGLIAQAAALTGARVVVVDDDLDAGDAVSLAAEAVFVISGHPQLVGAGAASRVPVLAISHDAAADRVLTRMLAEFGLADAVVPASCIATGDALELVERLMRDDATAPTDVVSALLEQDAQWWNDVGEVLAGRSAAARTRVPVGQAALLSETARTRVAALRELQRVEFTRRTGADSPTQADQVAAAARIAELENDAARLAAERDALSSEVAELQLALRAAHSLTGEIEQRLRPAHPRPSAVAQAERQTREAVGKVARRVSARLGAVSRD